MKIIVGISGGVDSAVCAALLKKEGHEVIGATMRTYDTPQSLREQADAAAVSARLGIRHVVYDYREAFRREVISYFVDAYTHGRTPNPCCICNRRVKFDMLVRAMQEQSADAIATGHYARVEQVTDCALLRYALRCADSDAKDQAYALYNLTQEQLAHLVLPLGGMTKDQVREFARREGLFVAEKHDSLDICFIPDGDYRGFIEDFVLGKDRRERQALGLPVLCWMQRGRFVDREGRPLGWHDGIIRYTIGQRRGLSIPSEERLYVTGIDAARNEVIVGRNEELFTDTLTCTDMNWMGMSEIRKGDVIECKGKIRYKDKGTDCILQMTKQGVRVTFKEPVRAVTPGQAAVFYRDGLVLCGGLIV